jgi:LmbE family N-acetylglucosaminyl deacetylase
MSKGLQARPARILALVAHPDDAEISAGGLLQVHQKLGSVLRLISVTDGQSGHHQEPAGSLVERRRAEAARAGELLGAEYWTWYFPDGYLTPSLEVRERIIVAIREFQPDLVLTHRPYDYHPDHRAVGQAVQDASYMVTVPKVAPHQPALTRDPVVAYLPDPYTRPVPLRPDLVLDASEGIDLIVRMMACHESQVFEWLPFNQGIADQVPEAPGARMAWLRGWVLQFTSYRKRFWNATWGPYPTLVEAFEVSEYAGPLADDDVERLFPQAHKSNASS